MVSFNPPCRRLLSLSESHQCGPGEFTCARGVCIRQAWRCDGDNDCRDWSDEANCTVGHHTCEAHSFQCHTGHCIPQRWMCDGDDDCQDGSDEDPPYCGTPTPTRSFRTRGWSYTFNSLLGFQRALSVTASCAPTTPAFLPPPTATASRSVQTAPTSKTAVSGGDFGGEASAQTRPERLPMARRASVHALHGVRVSEPRPVPVPVPGLRRHQALRRRLGRGRRVCRLR